MTHGDRGSPFLEHVDEARAAAASYGEIADGNFDAPPANYFAPKVDAGDAGAIPFPGGMPMTPAPLPPPPPPAAPDQPDLDLGDGSVQRFLEAALAQQGDRYVFDAQTNGTTRTRTSSTAPSSSSGPPPRPTCGCPRRRTCSTSR